MIRISWVFTVWFLLNQNSFAIAQDFLEGMALYNAGDYQAVIDYVPGFLEQNPGAEGLARYFLAESYYNQAVAASDREQARTLFQRARTEFRRATDSPDLKSRYEAFSHFAQYKMAWCSFRLAELNQEPLKRLDTAYAEFLHAAADAPDSIRVFSYYMAGEARLLQNSLKLSHLLATETSDADLNPLLKSYTTLSSLYDRILRASPSDNAPRNLKELQRLARLRKEDVKFYLGHLYQTLSPQRFERLADANKKFSAKKTALFYFNQLNYQALGVEEQQAQSNFSQAVTYLNMMRALHRYYSDRARSTKADFLRRWSRITKPRLQNEKLLRRGHLYHSNADLSSEEFSVLASTYYDSARALAEASYWLGYLQMIQNEKISSKENLSRFIHWAGARDFLTTRQRVLWEDARYREFLLDFESYYLSNRIGRLKQLREEIDDFAPTHPGTRYARQQLRLLINCVLSRKPSQIWTRVLQGSENQKLEQAVRTIKFILPRAAFNIGKTRQKYIALLNTLLALTAERRSAETLFFKGIVKSLEAEIQARPEEKKVMFKAAAATLSRVNKDFQYKSEAEYVRARCLFFADEVEQAKRLFTRLINQDRNIRALFYLGELFRIEGQGLAARKCYDVILARAGTSDESQSSFWVYNAEAGRALTDEAGDLSVLNGVNIAQVSFSNIVGRQKLTYENLADDGFLRQEFARESVRWLINFGLPKKEFYPSKHKLRHSILLAENIFDDFTGPIDEIRGQVTAQLALSVYYEGAADAETEVRLGGEILPGRNGTFLKKRIPLNSEMVVTVASKDHYLFKDVYQSTKPGVDYLTVYLNKKLAFTKRSHGKAAEQRLAPFRPRWDANAILKPDLPPLSVDSEIVRDFTDHYQLRDCAFDPVGHRLLAVNSAENAVWIYSADPASKRLGVLNLKLPDALNSPEGIAVDSQGAIFVADWGNHRVVLFDNGGNYTREIGSFGTNAPADVGSPVKVVYPTRVAVLEDLDGIELNGQKYRREKYLLVADRNGIQLSNWGGAYLGTLLAPTVELRKGSFYAFQMHGYGQGARLFLARRQAPSRRGQVMEFVAN
ncbi:MAG: SMP-30/gluconolactonase/LRE family protein [bacterium]